MQIPREEAVRKQRQRLEGWSSQPKNAKDCWQSLDTGSCQTPCFLTCSIQNCKTINFCCSEIPSGCPLVMAALGNYYRSLAFCSLWGRKESDTTERLNWTEETILRRISHLGAVVMSYPPVPLTVLSSKRVGWPKMLKELLEKYTLLEGTAF